MRMNQSDRGTLRMQRVNCFSPRRMSNACTAFAKMKIRKRREKFALNFCFVHVFLKLVTQKLGHVCGKCVYIQ